MPNVPTPRWDKVPASLIAIIDHAAVELPGVERRAMFGCPCLFLNGNMMAAAHFTGLCLRLSESDRAELLGTDGASPFEPMPGRTMREYVVPPPSIIADPALLSEWLERSREFVASLPAKEPKKSAPPKRRAG